MTTHSAATLDALLAEIDPERLATRVSERLSVQEEYARDCFTAIVSEARMALDWLVAEKAPLSGRVFEIGAGSGLLATALRAQGVDIAAIEPVGKGFDFTDAVQEAIAEAVGPRAVAPWRIPAEELDPARHGTFDFIFSINVLEHMQPLDPNLDGLARVLAPDGLMLHTCPNYAFPYEPHYRLPLLPGAPSRTPLLGAVRAEPLWQSLNFITARRMKCFAARNGLTLKLARGALAEAIERTAADKSFAERHRGAPALMIAAARRLGLVPLLRRLPAEWVTPMTARLTWSSTPAHAGSRAPR